MDVLIPALFAVALTVAAFGVALVITRAKPRHAPPSAPPAATLEAASKPSAPKAAPGAFIKRWQAFAASQASRALKLLSRIPRATAAARSRVVAMSARLAPKPTAPPASAKKATPAAPQAKPFAKLRAKKSAPEPELPPYRSPEVTRGIQNFTGRSTELAEIESKLATGGMLVVQGSAGMGKSSIALEYAQLNAEKYGAVCWLDAEREGGIVEALLQLGAHYMPELQKAADRHAAAQQVLMSLFPRFSSPGAKPALLVFDNIENPKLVERWRPREGAHVLITSRLSNWKEGIPVITLAALPLEDAIAYLQRESARTDLIGNKTATARQIAERLSCLPLALAQAAAFLKRAPTMSSHLYIELLDKHIAALAEWNSYDRSLFATFHETIFQTEQEAPGAAVILCFASCFAPSAIPKELFEQDAELYPEGRLLLPGTATVTSNLRSAITDPQIRAFALRMLDRFSLITYVEQTNTFDMHRSVQAVGRNLLRGQLQPWLESAIQIIEATFPPVRFNNWHACERLVWHAYAAFEALQPKCALPAAARLAERCGSYLRERAAYREAEALFRRALAVEGTVNGPLHPNVAIHLNNLAGILFDTNRYDEAEPLYRRALEINETRYGPEHPQVAGTLNRLAGGLSATNRLDEAERLYRRALEIEEYYNGPNHPRVAIYLNDFGWVLYETNRLTQAEESYLRALAIFEENYGPKHPNVARTLSNLAVLFAGTNRLSEGEGLLRRALEIDEASYGSDHPNVARDLGNLALLLSSANQLEEAEGLFRRALKINETTYGPDHPNVARALNNLARVLFETQRFAEAEPLYRNALNIFEASYGHEHPAFAAELINLAGLLRATQRFEEAESFARRALTITEASYGPKHPNVGKALHILAGILSATHRGEEANALNHRAYEILKTDSGLESSGLAIDLENLQWLLANSEETGAQTALGARGQDDESAAATSLESFTGLLLFSSNRHTEVESLYQRSFAVDEALAQEQVRADAY